MNVDAVDNLNLSMYWKRGLLSIGSKCSILSIEHFKAKVSCSELLTLLPFSVLIPGIYPLFEFCKYRFEFYKTAGVPCRNFTTTGPFLEINSDSVFKLNSWLKQRLSKIFTGKNSIGCRTILKKILVILTCSI